MISAQFFRRAALCLLGLALVLPAVTAPPPGYHLTWGDEFDGAALDSSKWSWGSLPWGGQHHNDQYSSYITSADSFLTNGSLVLRCRQGNFGGYPWSEGFVHSNGKFRYTYGYAEVRARWAIAKGTWPAFWSLSDGWPPEFDICEPFGSDNRVHMGLYHAGNPDAWDSSNFYNEGWDQWHTYGLAWGPGFAVWYKDGTVKKTINASYVPSQSMYLILNSGMRYDYDGSTPNPNQSEIDYCRVYLPGASTPPTISDLGSRTTPTNTPTPPLPFTIGDAETPLNMLILSATSGNTTVVPTANIVINGTGANRTVTVTPAPNTGGAALITLSVFDGEFTVNETFNVTVNGTNSAPFISSINDFTIKTGGAIAGRSFVVTDNETPDENLTLSATTSNPDLVPLGSIVFSGSGSNRAVIVTPAVGYTGSSDIDVIVSDGALTAHDIFRVTVVDANNVVESPGLENGLTGWTNVFGGTVSTVTSPVHDGNVAGRLSGRGDWYHGIGASLLGKIVSGQPYQGSAWVRITGTNDNAYLSVRVIDGSGTHYYRLVDGRASSTAWTRLSGEFTPVIVGTATSIVLYAEGPAAAATIYVDDISVAPGDPNVIVPLGSPWKYRDTGVFPGATWTSTSFNDSGWTEGPAQLGYGDGDEARVVSYGPASTNKYITTWFRRSFNAPNPWAWTNLFLRLIRDDGAVAYLNGVEIFRDNMPAGIVTPSTLALVAIGGADESRLIGTSVNPALLLQGTNVLAVEIHQEDPTNSSDISFDLELTGSGPAPELLIPSGSAWRYRDTGQNLGTVWRGTNYDDSAWSEGFAQLGYGDGDENTIVSYGPNSSSKYITTYFRRALVLPDASTYLQFVLRLLRDDGAIVYVNGTEVFRSNLPNGQPVIYSTLATNAADDGLVWQTTALPSALFVAGTNVLAVEVHQTSATSSDLTFDLELIAYRAETLPALSVTMDGGGLHVRWPAWAAGYQLYSASSLASPGVWTAVPNGAFATGGQWEVSLPPPPGGRFYRLSRP